MTEPTRCKLFVERHEIAIDRVPALFGPTAVAAAFVSTPDEFYISRVDGERLIVAAGKQERPLDPATLATAYELRALGDKAEVRWTRNGRSGRATVISENGEGKPYECIDRLECNYLLWGDAAAGTIERPDGWSAVSGGRVGAVLLPAPEGDGRLRLRAREYIKAGPHGNAYVLAERYMGFVRMPDGDMPDQNAGGDT
jgi:CRISPR-associated protein (TIGR03984 family)